MSDHNFPPLFYKLYIHDPVFGAWRSKITGHRAINDDGSPVKETRKLALRRPWLAFAELRGRHEAREAGRRDDEAIRARG
jgi:hypothetical protein